HVPERHRPLDLPPLVQLVIASVTLVIVGLARQHEHVRGRARKPGLETRIVACERSQIGQQSRIVDDEQALALAEARTRRAAHGGDDALERLPWNLLARVVPDHAPPLEDVAQVQPLPYSHSIVAGGFDVTSSTTRFTPGISFTILLEIVSSR